MRRWIFPALALSLTVCLAAKERVLLGAHFQREIPMYPTMQATSKTLGSPLRRAGKVYAISNSWYFSSYQPARTVAQFYADRWPQATREAKAANHIIFTMRPEGGRKLALSAADGDAFEWIEIEVADMEALNQAVKQSSRTPRTSVHISEFLAP